MANEEWRPIPIRPWTGYYEISNLGRVRVAPRIIPPRNIGGYPTVNLRSNGSAHTVRVHRLIASAFIRPPRKGEVTNHINANRADNRIENLEWTTPKGNTEHCMKLRRFRFGTEHPLGKIDHNVAFAMYKDGIAVREIARHFKVTNQAVFQMIKRAKKHGRL